MKDLKRLKDALKNNMPNQALAGFLNLYRNYKMGMEPLGDWDSLVSPDSHLLPRYEFLSNPASKAVKQTLEKLVVCKLNGGLGTTMGCQGPKSAIMVREGLSFLDIIVRQLQEMNRQQGVSIPLVLMNSFHTHEDTLKALGQYQEHLAVQTFQQNRYPRLRKDSELPLDESLFGSVAWYPPGHGDFFQCVYDQGFLDRWLDGGKELLFISNSDNLGAVTDERIASYMLESECSFLMEVTEKTAADVKGGTLYQEGERLRLLEIAQVPHKHMNDFCGTKKFKIFNTNNLWINLVHLKKRYENGSFPLRVIVNPKEVDGEEVVQLETAMGFGIDNFENSIGLIVPRDRYLPVKRTSDLLLVQSDLFVLEEGKLRRNSARKLPDLPVVQFGNHLSQLADYQNRIPEVPSLLELESLQVEGDVRIEEGVALKGQLVLAPKNVPLIVTAHSVLVNEEIMD